MSVSPLRCWSHAKGPEQRPGPMIELDEELDVVKPERLNRPGDCTQKKNQQIGPKEKPETHDESYHVSAVNPGKHEEVERDRVEGEDDRLFRHPDSREARVRYEVRHEPKDFHNVEGSFCDEHHDDADAQEVEGRRRNRVLGGEAEVRHRDPRLGEPAQRTVPESLTEPGPARRPVHDDREESREDQEPPDLPRGVSLAVPRFVYDSDQEARPELQIRDRDRQDDEIGNLVELL